MPLVEDSRWHTTVDRGKVFLLGRSAGAVMALLEGLTARNVAYRGAVGTLHPQLRSIIRRQADPVLIERIKGMTFCFLVGADDRNFRPASVKGDADLLKGTGAAVVFKELPKWGHAYPVAENAAIAEWLSQQWAIGKKRSAISNQRSERTVAASPLTADR